MCLPYSLSFIAPEALPLVTAVSVYRKSLHWLRSCRRNVDASLFALLNRSSVSFCADVKKLESMSCT